MNRHPEPAGAGGSGTAGDRLHWRGVIGEYRDFLPVSEATPVVTLREGGTPLLAAPRLSERVGARVFLKVEGANPTGSFKDRGMTVAISKAVERGATAVLCASTGNTSASAAAYAARAGLTCAVLIPDGAVALGKLAQALVYGARVVSIAGSFDRALAIARELADGAGMTLVNSVNPDRIEGQKTAAFEVVDELGDAPDLLCIPVGNAGNITAWWKGFGEYRAAGRGDRTPVMRGFQAEGAAPLVYGAPVAEPRTIASAIRIGRPVSWDGAMAAVSESGGGMHAVSDDEILLAWRYLAQAESVFCEPASAASVAGLLKVGASPGSTVVCVLTGNGLKDPDTAIAGARLGRAVEPVPEAVLKVLSRPAVPVGVPGA